MRLQIINLLSQEDIENSSRNLVSANGSQCACWSCTMQGDRGCVFQGAA